MKLLLVLATCLVASDAASCPSPPVVQNFNLTSFSGLWYQQVGLPTDFFFQGMGTCVTAQYTLDSCGDAVTVVNRRKNLSGTPEKVIGTAVLAGKTKTEGVLAVTIHTSDGKATLPLSCLSTDYNRFAILYSCVSNNGLVEEYIYGLSRTQHLVDQEKKDYEELIETTLDDIENEDGPAFRTLMAIPQTNC